MLGKGIRSFRDLMNFLVVLCFFGYEMSKGGKQRVGRGGTSRGEDVEHAPLEMDVCCSQADTRPSRKRSYDRNRQINSRLRGWILVPLECG